MWLSIERVEVTIKMCVRGKTLQAGRKSRMFSSQIFRREYG